MPFPHRGVIATLACWFFLISPTIRSCPDKSRDNECTTPRIPSGLTSFPPSTICMSKWGTVRQWSPAPQMSSGLDGCSQECSAWCPAPFPSMSELSHPFHSLLPVIISPCISFSLSILLSQKVSVLTQKGRMTVGLSAISFSDEGFWKTLFRTALSQVRYCLT